MYQTITPKMDTTHPLYAELQDTLARARQLGDAGDFAAADLIFQGAYALEAQVPKTELTELEKAVNWWHDELSVNEQKAWIAKAGLDGAQLYNRSTYRSKLALMYQMSQAVN